MKNEQLEVAREYLNEVGIANLTDETILELIRRVSKSKPTVYEPGDFVMFSMGMGETGYGTIRHASGGGGLMGNSPMVYGVDFWFPDDQKLFSHISEGDVQGLSTPEKALEYYRARSA